MADTHPEIADVLEELTKALEVVLVMSGHLAEQVGFLLLEGDYLERLENLGGHIKLATAVLGSGGDDD